MSCPARLLDDVGGVLPHPRDQRRAARVLVLHPEEVQARGLGDASPMLRHAALIEDRHTKPRVVGAIAGPQITAHIDRAAALEAHGSALGVDGTPEKLDSM